MPGMSPFDLLDARRAPVTRASAVAIVRLETVATSRSSTNFADNRSVPHRAADSSDAVAAVKRPLGDGEDGHVIRLDGNPAAAPVPDVLFEPRYRPLSDGRMAVAQPLAWRTRSRPLSEPGDRTASGRSSPCGAGQSECSTSRESAVPESNGRSFDLAELHDPLDLLGRGGYSWAGERPRRRSFQLRGQGCAGCNSAASSHRRPHTQQDEAGVAAQRKLKGSPFAFCDEWSGCR